MQAIEEINVFVLDTSKAFIKSDNINSINQSRYKITCIYINKSLFWIFAFSVRGVQLFNNIYIVKDKQIQQVRYTIKEKLAGEKLENQG